MKREKKTLEYEKLTSDFMPEVTTSTPGYAEAIEWADANPVAWRIVTQTKSKAFGRGSSFYLGCVQDGKDPETVLERVAALKFELDRPRHYDAKVGIAPVDDFHLWKVKFTLAHYEDRGFKGGFFQQIDVAGYSRGCSHLDYTDETLPEVLRRFQEWCDQGYKFETQHVQIDKRVVPASVRELPPVQPRFPTGPRKIRGTIKT